MADFAKLQSLFEQACELPPGQQAAFVDQACAGDAQLHAELTGLLASDEAVKDHTARKAVGDLSALLHEGRPDALVGAQVGRYTLVSCIGAGGMGSVYLAERNDGVVQQRVAIKFLGRDLLGDGFRQRFEVEREILAKLDHPNITRLIDAEQLPDGTPYYVMDYVEGQPITRYAFDQQLDINARLDLFVAVAKAVAHAHQALIVHRDIKPGNILVDGHGAPHLLDFGIAKPLAQLGAQTVSMTVTGQRFFSPQHAAPEQLLGGNITVGCDVYGLGCLLYELLSGEPAIPLTGLTASEAEKLILHQLPQTPSQRVAQGSVSPERAAGFGSSNAKAWSKSIKGELDSIVLTCLRKLPHERYRSVDDLIADVQAYQAGMPIVASGGHRWYRTRKFVVRHRWAVTAAALTAIALISSSVVTALQSREATRQRDAAQTALGQAEQQRDRAQRVTQFLIDAFAAANPGGELGKSVTAKDILEHGAKKLDTELLDQPELKAQLLATIAEAQRALSLVDEAVETANRAAELILYSSDVELAVSVMLVQIRVLVDDEKVDEAEAVLRRARSLNPQSERIIAGLARNEVELLSKQGYQIEGVQRSGQLLQGMSNFTSTESLTDRYWLRLKRIQLLGKTGSPSKAAAEMSELEHSFVDAPPSEIQLRLKALRLGAQIESKAGNNERAEALTLEALALARETFGDVSIMTFAARQGYSNVLLRNKKFIEASRESNNALDLARMLFGSDHITVDVALFNAAYAKSRTGDMPGAELLFREAISRAEKNSRPTDKALFTYRAYFAEFLGRRGKCNEGIKVAMVAEDAFKLEPEYMTADGRTPIRHIREELCVPN